MGLGSWGLMGLAWPSLRILRSLICLMAHKLLDNREVDSLRSGLC